MSDGRTMRSDALHVHDAQAAGALQPFGHCQLPRDTRCLSEMRQAFVVEIYADFGEVRHERY